MAVDTHIPAGRKAFANEDWTRAYDRLSKADGEQPLGPEDVERLAFSAYLVGRDVESTELFRRAHSTFLDCGSVERAVRCAFWLAFGLFNRGDAARAMGWVSRAERLLDDAEHDCVERGYLLFFAAVRFLQEGKVDASHETFRETEKIGRRFNDGDLAAFGRHGRGRALIRAGKTAEGMTLLDEVMVAVDAEDVSPIVAADIYCSVIEACQELYDLRRAEQWTGVLSRWCDQHSDIVPYQGECRVRRAEIMQLQGRWTQAITEAEQACKWLTRPPGRSAAGAAYYRRAELHRLQGEFKLSEEAYREANKWGRKPQPGLALLRLAQARTDAAGAAIRRVEDEAADHRARSNILPAYVEIMLALDDVDSARAAAEELSEIALELEARFLSAAAGHAKGAVLLSESDAANALGELRTAWKIWNEIEAPYEAARTKLLIAKACRSLGDDDTAALELEAARWTFEQLGAQPDLERVDAIRRDSVGISHELTPRELEVLNLVASGKSNKAIAESLFISERTVERHVSSVLAKLRVSSRTAAAAYAFEHGLV